MTVGLQEHNQGLNLHSHIELSVFEQKQPFDSLNYHYVFVFVHSATVSLKKYADWAVLVS